MKNWIKDGKFVELTKEQISELTDAEAIEYMVAKSESKLNGVITTSKEQYDELKSMLDAVNDSIKSAKIDEVKANMEGLNKAIKAVKVSNGQPTQRTLNDVIKSNYEAIKKTIGQKGAGHEFVAKTDVTRASITNSPSAMVLPEIGQLPNPKPAIVDAFRKTPVANVQGKNTVGYFDTTSATRNADSIAENTTYPESAITWEYYTLKLEKYGDSIPVTYEMIEDYPRFYAELERLLRINTDRKLNADAWSGNGTTPNIKGIYTYATAFNAGAYAGNTFTDANLLDLFDVLRDEIMDGKDDKYNPTTIIMNHKDYTALKNVKDANGQYLWRDMIDSMGYNIITSSYVTVNTMVIGDFDYAQMFILDAPTIEIGEATGDWENDRKSLKVRTRAGLLVKNADLDGFLKVTSISAAITAITT